MCGIAGILRLDERRPDDRDTLRAMRERWLTGGRTATGRSFGELCA